MPRSAIMTGLVDLVLPAAKIPEALVKYRSRMALALTQNSLHRKDPKRDWLSEIIDLLRTKTAHDFTLYKQGTLRRRIERRMAMATVEAGDTDRYLDMLRNDANELDVLAKGF
jgi:two-component system CheB/CheR fusion protein